MKNFLIIIFWIISIIIASLYTYENPETVEGIKSYFDKKKEPEIEIEKTEKYKVLANSFSVEFSQTISLSEKTSFIIYDKKESTFDVNSLIIYTQNGYVAKNLKFKKINLPNTFTMQRNGGVKTIFVYKKNVFALISALKNNCLYASIVLLKNKKEVFKTKCLPDVKKNTDFNGLGSSSIHTNDSVFISIGAPEQRSSKIRKLAQRTDSMFGKIIRINKSDLDELVMDKKNILNVNIFTLGHRNPQGLTKIKNSIFSVEHGPLGGDELNKIVENSNYGWPQVSYGTQYLYEEEGKAYDLDHENKGFKEPLFALNPSVGISSLNVCPNKLNEFYKKPCLMALSLYGNNLRPGRSLIIFLLNNKMDKVLSTEQIFLKNDLLLRHFVTNLKNEIYEDKDGNIYISADKKGIYKLKFTDFRN